MLRNFWFLKHPNKLRSLVSAHQANMLRRNLNFSAIVNTKMFMEYENKYAYNIMTNKGYGISFNIEADGEILSKEQFTEIISTNWLNVSPRELYQIFPKFGMYCTKNNLCISNKIFDQYIDTLTDNIKHATDHELKSLFYSLKLWPDTESVRTRNYIEVWAALDDECFKRIPRWSFDDMLSFLALFFMINVTRFSDFSFKCLQKLASKAKQLNAPQIVQTMFFVAVFRKPPFDMHNLEVCIEKNFSLFSVDELSIISMGFFKSKTPIRSMDLLGKFINKVVEDSKVIHEMSLASLLKVIRYSKNINCDDSIYQMLDVIQHEAPRLSVMCNVHMALVGTATLTFHEGCLTKIADAINIAMSRTRLKDLERLVLSYGMFNFKPRTKECFFTNIINELRKSEREYEINRYGRSFVYCVGYLGQLEFYPIDLIRKALSPEFLERTYGKPYAYGREVLVVNNIANIFCKDSKINLLSAKDVNIVSKSHTDYVPSENYSKQYNVTEKMFLDVMKILIESRGGPEYVNGSHILSHYQRGDIIICNDHHGRPVPVNNMFEKKMFGLIYPPPDENKWIILIIAGRNAMIYKSNLATGLYYAKVRELNAIGYHATLVLWSVYSKCKSREEKLEYFNSLINSVAT